MAILIGGPTASGKTQLAYELQSRIPSVIINSDSMQVYNDLKILTNIPSKNDLKQFNCELFGFINYPKSCSLGFWKENVELILKNKEKKIPIFVGGTGLYLDSLIHGISPIPKTPEKIRLKIRNIHKKLGNHYFFEKLKKIDKKYSQIISKNDSQRLLRAMEVKVVTGKPFSKWHEIKMKGIFERYIYVVIKNDREALYRRINERCSSMVETGVIEEVDGFLKKKRSKNHPIYKSIGLESFEQYLNGQINLDDSISDFMQETRRYAKRQITWFKNRSKHSKHLNLNQAKNFILRNI